MRFEKGVAWLGSGIVNLPMRAEKFEDIEQAEKAFAQMRV